MNIFKDVGYFYIPTFGELAICDDNVENAITITFTPPHRIKLIETMQTRRSGLYNCIQYASRINLKIMRSFSFSPISDFFCSYTDNSSDIYILFGIYNLGFSI